MADIQNGNELVKADIFKKMNLEEGMHVGDLGCGNLAFYAFGAAKLVGKKGLVYAVDILKTALNAVDNKIRNDGIDNIQTVWSNMEIVGATNIPASSLDAAFIHNVLFQSADHDEFIKETNRLLKTNGKLMIVDWKRTGAPFGPPLKDRPDPELIKKMTQKNGFTLTEEFEAGPYHFGLIFVKVS